MPDPVLQTPSAMADGDKMAAWLREAADELDKAHAYLDANEVPRSLSGDGVECTLAARIAMAMDPVQENRAHLSREVKRMRDAFYAIAPLAEVPGTPTVVREKLLGNIRKALGEADA